ncbi:hypothetical protein ACN47A_23500 [Myxococcus fulvus]|uniref:hypothetical protein n=1 Tax=Myxococcus fulvus TaxID=33 RepID=UPI003B99A3BB
MNKTAWRGSLGLVCLAWLMGCGDLGEPEPARQRADRLDSEELVRVTRATRFHTSAGVIERGDDPAVETPEVLLHDGADFTRIAGTAVPEGGWLFAGVPRTEYYLRTGRSFILTSARHVELGSQRLGRPDAVYSSVDEVPLHLRLHGLSPWTPATSDSQTGARLQVVSAEVDVAGEVTGLDRISAGVTSIVTEHAQTYSTRGVGFASFEAGRGDRLYVNQLGEFIAGALPDGARLGYSALERSVQMEPFDYRPGWFDPMLAAGWLEPLEMREFLLDWRLSEFARWVPDAHSRAEIRGPSFKVMPAAHGLEEGWIGSSGDLLWLNLPQRTRQDFTGRLKFGNPYPRSWGVAVEVRFPYSSREWSPRAPWYMLTLGGGYTARETLEDILAGPVLPKVSPPRWLRIDGERADPPPQVGSRTPWLSWTPPELGSPTAYQVTVWKLAEGVTLMATTGSLLVPGTVREVRLPPGLLEPGSISYVTVAAIDAPHLDVEQAPFRTQSRLPYRSALAYSSFFIVP